MLSKCVMKKVRAESVTLKRELHGLLNAPGSVLGKLNKHLSGHSFSYISTSKNSVS